MRTNWLSDFPTALLAGTAVKGVADGPGGFVTGTVKGTGQATVGVAKGTGTVAKKTGKGVWCIVTLGYGC